MMITTRTYGWVQNPSDFSKLKKTVQIFDEKSEHYINLRDDLIENIIYFKDLKEKLQKKFDNNIVTFSYTELVGTSIDKNNKNTRKRLEAIANGIIQISLLPQKYETTGKLYSDNWTSDGFLRWAVSLNFLKPNRKDDTYTITEEGKRFSRSQSHDDEIDILRDAFLSYPPATRILDLLSDNIPRNKFYLGNKLGFRGEKGFTSYSGKIMEKWLLNEFDPKEISKIRSDVEGTSDKYARMICSWLIKVDFVERNTKKVGGKTSFQEYTITGKGLHSYRQSMGTSSKKIQPKFLTWEFLAVAEYNRDYIRTRRAHILKFLDEPISLSKLRELLKLKGFKDEVEIIKNDIEGLRNSGFRINEGEGKLQLIDILNDFEIPLVAVTPEISSIIKDKERAQLLKDTNLDIKYIELLEIAFDSNRNRDFEIITTELINDVYGITSLHLGGGRKPDGISFTEDYGIIYDTKAYKDGYGKNINEADKMIRYIKDNKLRNSVRNATEWWLPFPKSIDEKKYFYLWISGRYKSSFSSQLEYVSNDTGVNGAGITIKALLLGADKISKKQLTLKEIPSYFKNELITAEN